MAASGTTEVVAFQNKYIRTEVVPFQNWFRRELQRAPDGLRVRRTLGWPHRYDSRPGHADSHRVHRWRRLERCLGDGA